MGTTVNGFSFPFYCIAPVPFWDHVSAMPAVGAKAFRKKNFAYLVEEVWQGNRLLVADALGFGSPALVTRYMTTGKSSKPVGDDVARKIEVAARTAGASWVFDGFLDTPHEPPAPPDDSLRKTSRLGTLDERIRALPDPLRRYLLMELDICERVQHLAPSEFMRAPTLQNRRAFQDYIQGILAQVKRNAA